MRAQRHARPFITKERLTDNLGPQPEFQFQVGKNDALPPPRQKMFRHRCDANVSMNLSKLSFSVNNPLHGFLELFATERLRGFHKRVFWQGGKTLSINSGIVLP
jgi:hypothetical protein